ncbi:hypothetical protein TrCOL_g6760 [Triparma columacea]|uniref:Uncharacterized protein n=1 Tax=Triparma columacea TaxID=722753 RepID=A0A9W7L4S1_9STRA|nr:hypothetical protein TrCOL_g6760 [Triparma columacea]
MSNFVGVVSSSPPSQPSSSGGFSPRLSSPSRLPSTLQDKLEKESWSTVSEQRRIHKEIDKETKVIEARSKVGKENAGLGTLGGLGGGGVGCDSHEFEKNRKAQEGAEGRAHASDFNSARRKVKALAKEEKKEEVAFNLNIERDFERRMMTQRKAEAEERRKAQREEWEARRAAKEAMKRSEGDALRAQVAYEREQRIREAEIKEKARLEKVQERRRRIINKREEKRRLEKEMIERKQTEHKEFEEEWEKEQTHRTEIGKAKKVKDRVYKNLGRLNEETSLLDIPFGA